MLQITRLTLTITALGALLPWRSTATPAFFGGLCSFDDIPYVCGPTEAGCVPKSGLLIFNSVAPNVPAYWTFAVRRSRVAGRFSGKLSVAAAESMKPSVPGAFANCENGLCMGRSARVIGEVVGDRFTAIARYYGGARCEFEGTIRFGFGGEEPNAFVCRDAGGRTMTSGRFRVQGIRLACAEE